MNNNTIPEEAVVKFKCSFCNNYLSYFPISLTEGNQNVCGRCSFPKGIIVTYHNKIFEEIVQHFKFPCRYKEQGCYKELLPKDVPSHEKNCYFKLVKCPGEEFTNCSWQGAPNRMLHHCRDAHQDVYLKNKAFELDLNNFICMQRFLEYDGNLFIVSINRELADLLSFMIYHVDDEITDLENYSYQIVLRKGKRNVIVESVTKTFSEKDWCRPCRILLHSLIDSEDVEASLIIGSVVFEKSVDIITGIAKGFNEKLLSLLVCSSCKNYVLPPIKCESGEVKCENCATDKCIPNTNLDEIAEMVDYPCRNKKNGCDVVLKSEKMRKHLAVCSFEKRVCLLCEEFRSDLKKNFEDHVFTTHRDIIIENDEIISVELNKPSLRRVVCYGGHIFLLQFNIIKYDYFEDSVIKSDYIWKVYSISMKSKTEEEFQYKIEIMNPKYKDIRLLMEQKHINRDESCVLEDIPKLLNLEDKISFKVKIFKI